MPQFGDVHRNHAKGPVEVLAIATRWSAEQVAEYAREVKLDFPVALDSDRAVTKAYSIDRVPTLVFTDADGKVLRSYVGGTDELPEVVDDTLEAIAEGQPLPEYEIIGGG
jgi:peroxiredoxin